MLHAKQFIEINTLETFAFQLERMPIKIISLVKCSEKLFFDLISINLFDNVDKNSPAHPILN